MLKKEEEGGFPQGSPPSYNSLSAEDEADHGPQRVTRIRTAGSLSAHAGSCLGCFSITPLMVVPGDLRAIQDRAECPDSTHISPFPAAGSALVGMGMVRDMKGSSADTCNSFRHGSILQLKGHAVASSTACFCMRERRYCEVVRLCGMGGEYDWTPPCMLCDQAASSDYWAQVCQRAIARASRPYGHLYSECSESGSYPPLGLFAGISLSTPARAGRRFS